MKRKNIIILSMILMLTLVFSGCEKETKVLSKTEVYTELVNKMSSAESYYMGFDGSMSVDMESTNPDIQLPKELTSMLSNIIFEGSFEIRKVNDNAELAFIYNVDLGGMSMDMEFYYDGNTVIIKYPMVDKYITVSLEDIIDLFQSSADDIYEEINFDNIASSSTKLIEDAYAISTESMLATVTDDDIELIDSYDYTNQGIVTSSKTLKLVIDSDFMLKYMDNMILDFKESKDFYNSLKAIVPDETFTYEKYTSYFDDFDTSSVLSSDELLAYQEALENVSYTVYIGYDDDYTVNNMSVDYDIEMTDEMTEMTTKMNALLNYTFKGINHIRKVAIPVLTEENSISLLELVEFADLI